MSEATNVWTCKCGALWTGEFAKVLKFCGACGEPRPAQAEVVAI